jgi:hypothetical protein
LLKFGAEVGPEGSEPGKCRASGPPEDIARERAITRRTGDLFPPYAAARLEILNVEL